MRLLGDVSLLLNLTYCAEPWSEQEWRILGLPTTCRPASASRRSGQQYMTSGCPRDCPFGLCPYPSASRRPRGRGELSAAFCQAQHDVAERLGPAPWHEGRVGAGPGRFLAVRRTGPRQPGRVGNQPVNTRKLLRGGMVADGIGTTIQRADVLIDGSLHCLDRDRGQRGVGGELRDHRAGGGAAWSARGSLTRMCTLRGRCWRTGMWRGRSRRGSRRWWSGRTGSRGSGPTRRRFGI